MKRLFMALLMIFIFEGLAWADYFQFMFRENRYYAAYAAVYVNDKRIGFTDKYGRIAIKLPDGTYRAEVRRRGQSAAVRITVDGSRYLKIVYLD